MTGARSGKEPFEGHAFLDPFRQATAGVGFEAGDDAVGKMIEITERRLFETLEGKQTRHRLRIFR